MSRVFLWKFWRNIVEIRRIDLFYIDLNHFLQPGNAFCREKSTLKLRVDTHFNDGLCKKLEVHSPMK